MKLKSRQDLKKQSISVCYVDRSVTFFFSVTLVIVTEKLCFSRFCFFFDFNFSLEQSY